MLFRYLPFCREKRKLSVRTTEEIRIGKPRSGSFSDLVHKWAERWNPFSGGWTKQGCVGVGGTRTSNSYISLFDVGRQITAAPITTGDPIVFYFCTSIQYKSGRTWGRPLAENMMEIKCFCFLTGDWWVMAWGRGCSLGQHYPNHYVIFKETALKRADFKIRI